MAKKAKRVVCAKCDKEFKIKLKELEFIQQGLIEIEGFECPHCRQKYVTVVTDNELRQSIYEASEVHKQIIELSRKRDREYKAYIEDVGSVPMTIVNKYLKDLEGLQKKYELICSFNRQKGKELKEQFCKK